MTQVDPGEIVSACAAAVLQILIDRGEIPPESTTELLTSSFRFRELLPDKTTVVCEVTWDVARSAATVTRHHPAA